MMRQMLAIAGLLLGTALIMHSSSAQAACTERQVKRLYEKHVSVAKIADRCEMTEEAVEEIVEEEDDSDSNPPPVSPAYTLPRTQAMCCDAGGNSRCPIIAGSTTIGAACFCPGQGYGIICR